MVMSKFWISGWQKALFFNTAFVGDKQPSTLLKISIEGGPSSTVYSKDGFSLYQPELSPDNKMIVFSGYSQENFEKRLYLADFDGNQVVKEITHLEFNLINGILWAPDGKSLTYWSVDGVPNIWKMSLEGKDKRQISNFNSGRISNFNWTNDGKQLLIVRPIVNNDLVLIKDLGNQKNGQK